ncbi:MAG TPA: MBOAT family O-acyltransferase [Parafilimonas sp.]|jgi:D-alanyl-lipoteichoic acid acyltransferase DltB (MBOAT superfamily)
MIFNSLAFIYFFIIVTTLFFFTPQKLRWALLLAASCVFYMYFIPIYILILGFTIGIDYFAGLFIAKSSGRKRKAWLVCSLIANIGVLAFFKYFNFLNSNLTALLGLIDYKNPIPYLNILLPIGLSFHTFQAMSYTIEVYRGNQQPEKHFGIYSLYVMFYPQLVAGPIERPQNILHQFHEEKFFDYDRVTEGLKIMLWGFVKKLVVADRLALYVNAVYGNAEHHSGVTLITATFFFIVQIYCDFSGYSDIAIGAAKIMGYNLMINFKRPFFSRNIQEVWQRWHISLTTWFRDYLYFPLGGSRKAIAITIRNLLIVFAISGLWHGAGWTFIIWGLLNGLVLALEQIFSPVLKFVNKTLGFAKNFVRTIFTVTLFVLMGIFFRSQNLQQASYIFTSIIHLKPGRLFLGEPPITFAYYIVALVILFGSEYLQEYHPDIKLIRNNNVAVRYSGYLLIIVLLIVTGVFNGTDFIYFQF